MKLFYLKLYRFLCSYVICYFIFLIISLPALSQNNITQRVDSMSNQFPKNTEICINAKSEISFKFTKKKLLFSYESVKEDLVHIKKNNNFIKKIYYDEKSEVTDAILVNERGKELLFDHTVTDAVINGIFHHDVKLVSLQKDFSSQRTNFGLSYTKKYYDPKFFTRVFFNDDYPILHKEISFVIPDWLEMEIVEMNFGNYDICKEVTTEKKTKTVKYIVSNLPPIAYEMNSPSVSSTYPHLVILIKSYKIKDVNYELIRNIDDLYKFYNSIVLLVNDESDKLISVVDELLVDCDSDYSKIETLFYWVQDNIRYIAFESGIMGYKPEGAYSVFYNRYGDCKGKANLLKEMLKIAGFDAKLAWIGTNSIPYDYTLPSLLVDNHMISVLDFDNKRYFLDATEEFIPINKHAQRIQGRQVMIQNGNYYVIDTIPTVDKIANKIEKFYTITSSSDMLKGSATHKYFGEQKIALLRSYHSANTSTRDQQLAKHLGNYDKNIQLFNLEHKNLEDRTQVLKFDFEFLVTNKVYDTGNSIY